MISGRECIGELVPRLYLPSVFVSTFAMVFLGTLLAFHNVPLSTLSGFSVSTLVLILVRARLISKFEP